MGVGMAGGVARGVGYPADASGSSRLLSESLTGWLVVAVRGGQWNSCLLRAYCVPVPQCYLGLLSRIGLGTWWWSTGQGQLRCVASAQSCSFSPSGLPAVQRHKQVE